MTIPVLKRQSKTDGHLDTSTRASHLRLLTTPEEIEGVRAFWERHQTFIYADIDFYLYELATCPNVLRPYVLLLSNNNRPTCLLVARITQPDLDWRLGYLQVSPSHARSVEVLPHGLLGEPSEADLLAIAEKLLEPLQTEKVDFVFLKLAETETRLAQAIRSVGPGVGQDATTTEEVPHWTLQLAGTFEDFVKSRRKRARNNIRKIFERIESGQAGNVSVSCYRLPSDVPRAASEADSIAAKTYQRGIGVGLSNTPALRSAWQYEAKKGWLRVYVLYLNGEPIAFEQGLVYKNAYLGVFSSYDPTYHYYRPGHYLFLRILKSLYSEGDIRIYDFGSGAAAYKEQFGSHCIGEYELYQFAPTLRGRCLKWIKTFASSFNQKGKQISARLKALDAIKGYWRRKVAGASAPRSGKLDN